MGDLGAAKRDRTEWDRALAAARGEANDLRSRLANMPTPTETAPGWTAVPGGAMIAIEGSVLFAPGKAALLPAGRAALDAITSVTLSGTGTLYVAGTLLVQHPNNSITAPLDIVTGGTLKLEGTAETVATGRVAAADEIEIERAVDGIAPANGELVEDLDVFDIHGQQ